MGTASCTYPESMMFDETSTEVGGTLAINIVNSVAKRYNIFDYYPNLFSLLGEVYPTDDLTVLTKYQVHEKLNEVLMENYRGECVIKYNLFERNRDNRDITGAFEINVNDSRLDFLTIGQHSTSYEIKSGLDSLAKLQKQCSDYLKVFEYNYVVVDSCHLAKALPMLPECYGIWLINDMGHATWQKIRESSLNTNIDSASQISLLTKRELIRHFPQARGIRDDILQQYSVESINEGFKTALRQRYSERWNFIVGNHAAIFPIDIQFFFKHNISPDCIYR